MDLAVREKAHTADSGGAGDASTIDDIAFSQAAEKVNTPMS
jgi:hypothetical protein